MSHLSKIFTRTPVEIPNRSGKDLSHETMLTQPCGTLVPLLCEELIPGDKVSLGYLGQVKLPPLATNFFGRVDYRVEAFFVPSRILWGGWQDFITMPVTNPFSSPVSRPSQVPRAEFSTPPSIDVYNSYFGRGTLRDYLGDKTSLNSMITIPNILPYVAYHKIYDDWYRNPLVQQPVFTDALVGSNTGAIYRLPYNAYAATYTTLPDLTSTTQLLDFADGVNLFSLRQRNWAKDYYTTCSLYPQANASVSGASAEVVDDTVTIASLRNANVLQRWLERNNVAGYRYADQIKATYGVDVPDAFLDHPLFLGSDSFGIYNRSIFQTGMDSTTDASTGNQIFKSIGAEYGNAQAVKDGSLVDDFEAKEFGYLMVLGSVVPHANYSTGRRRYLTHKVASDFANPLLQGLGEQAVAVSELDETGGDTIFGYQQQYSEYKYHDDEVHGELVDGHSLESFCLQRSFDVSPSLGDDFLQIPTGYLSQVLAYTEDSLFNGAWTDFFFKFKKVSVLSDYVIPTLGDLKNTHTETVPYRGKML